MGCFGYEEQRVESRDAITLVHFVKSNKVRERPSRPWNPLPSLTKSVGPYEGFQPGEHISAANLRRTMAVTQIAQIRLWYEQTQQLQENTPPLYMAPSLLEEDLFTSPEIVFFQVRSVNPMNNPMN